MKKAAGILLFRRRAGGIDVLLVHPGGPLWSRKDRGAWSIPKGEFTDEDPLDAARREFREETGFALGGEPRALDPLRQPGGKLVFAWAVEGDADPAALRSNAFAMEWPLKSGTMREFPEVDRAAWFPLDEAARRILKGQRGFLDQLRSRLG